MRRSRRRCRWRGFEPALTPLDPRVVAARPQPGQQWSAAGLLALLDGGSLTEAGAARRLQDPLSFRCTSQLHGSLRTALELLGAALEPELNGAADNPLVLADDGEILSTGNFHVPALALALDAVAIGIAQVAGGDRAAPGANEGHPAEWPAADADRRR